MIYLFDFINSDFTTAAVLNKLCMHYIIFTVFSYSLLKYNNKQYINYF